MPLGIERKKFNVHGQFLVLEYSDRVSVAYALSAVDHLAVILHSEGVMKRLAMDTGWHGSGSMTEPGAGDESGVSESKDRTIYQYPRRLAYLEFAAALLMAVALYVNTRPMWWGWLLFAPLFFYIVFVSVRTYRYALTIAGDRIAVSGTEREHRVSDITAINVWDAKGGRVAVITFADRGKISFPSHLQGFNDLVASLRRRTGLSKPEWEA
jgi:hypothetical protein